MREIYQVLIISGIVLCLVILDHYIIKWFTWRKRAKRVEHMLRRFD